MERKLVLKERYNLFIDGEFVPSQSGKYFSSVNPSNGETLAQVASGDGADVDKAVQAAWKAFPAWAAVSPGERAAVLTRIADVVDANAQLLAEAETLDNGKPLADSLWDVSDLADHFRYFAAAVRSEEGAYVPLSSESFCLLIREPIGVVAQIVPWNFPLATAGWKLAPALGAGNCVLFKPASNTSISMLLLAGLLQDVLPAGVLNVITGSGRVCGDALTSHPGIRKISFTGSTQVGTQIGKAAGARAVPVTLELGGKSANIVFPDCQWERALIGACTGILLNCGQVCSAGSRLFVHEDIYDRFLSDLAVKFQAVKIGDGFDPEVQMGPMVDASQLDTVLSYIEIGKSEGARLVCGGNRLTGPAYDSGFFVEPTLFADVDNSMRIAQEEIFGPVLVVIKFKDEAEAIRMANASPYGLAGGVWTQDINRGLRVAKAIEAGTVWINEFGPSPAGAAFGGYKESGYGREVHKQALTAYSQLKDIFINMDEAPSGLY